ncbi:cytochrome P450 [Pluteus cervinus]|uniref:Cytochrome P450 n=1 Tax=Pluteus cervinus TaxID=181527 RepID=A0ACD3AVI5_9AGAR|nr:cytochrome P450 [Pluteus cervinus]
MALLDVLGRFNAFDWSLGVTFLVLYAVLFYRRVPVKYPPGPKGALFVGNLFGMPQEHPWIAYKEWSKQYDSDVVSVSILGKRTVFVNSYAAAHDLFAKRSSIYNHRPDMPMLNDLLGWNEWALGEMQYGPDWKEQRKLFKQETEFPSAQSHKPHALHATRRFVKHVLETPQEYMAHLRHMTGQSILSSAYGIDVKPRDDPYVALAERAMYSLARAGILGTYFVDYFPLLKYVPSWFPGAQFKRDAEVWAEYIKELPDAGFQIAQQNFEEGNAKDCIATRVLERIQGDPEEEHKTWVLRNFLAGFYAAGTDATVCALTTFVLAMVVHPDIQRKAQAAIEAAVGKDRLPEFEDIQSIPYLHAIVNETLRWHPVAPLAVPHAAARDDIYEGYFIPQGAAVVGNAWAILRDESVYGPDTHLFKPERFLTKDGTALDPAIPEPDAAWGFGRRMCPGRVVAYLSMLITTASLLHCFSIEGVKDKEGKEVIPSVEYLTGMLSFPKPFRCEFRIRSPALERLVQDIPEKSE